MNQRAETILSPEFCNVSGDIDTSSTTQSPSELFEVPISPSTFGSGVGAKFVLSVRAVLAKSRVAVASAW
jgi:hypothetical protein